MANNQKKIPYKKNNKKPMTFYQAEIFVKGVRTSTKTFQTKKEAVLWHEKEKHKFQMTSNNLNQMIKLKDCVDRFLKDAKTRMGLNTLQRYEWHCTYFYQSPLAEIKMSEFKAAHVVEWIDWLKSNPKINPNRVSFKKGIKFTKYHIELV